MRRADRLFRIVEMLRGSRLLTARQLAERLEVSQRTIYRDMADLIGSGVPIDGEAGTGYLMRAGYDLPPLMFTQAEITALVAGARMLRAFGGAQMALAAEEALVKIDAVLPETARRHVAKVQIHAISHDPATAEERRLIDATLAAVDGRRKLEICYNDGDGNASDRTIRPLALHFWGRVWTLAAWCEMRADFRSFRPDRIRSLTPGEEFRDEPGKTLRDFYAMMNEEHRAVSPAMR